tara:strand:- start:347 stop:1408 length:1062 start_codon:yes stop_codon:yes gene_type:complete
MKPFQIVNWVAVLGHLIASIVFYSLYSQRENLLIPYTETYLKWNRTDNLTSCTSGSRPLETVNGNYWCIVPTSDGINCDESEPPNCDGLDLGWLIISFHLLSFFFQALAGCTDFWPLTLPGVCEEDEEDYTYEYRVMIEEKGRNPLRFIEYSISASIMLICIAFLNGVTDINLIAAIAVLTAMCQLCGLVVEYMNDDQLVWQWVLHLTGWIQFLCAYGIISHAFFKSITAAPGVRPPDFVYVIVFMLFALYACFGAVQLVELCQKTEKFLCCKAFLCIPCCGCKCGICDTCDCCGVRCKEAKNNNDFGDSNVKRVRRCDNECKELTYVILSLAAKLVLGTLIFTNVLFSTSEA